MVRCGAGMDMWGAYHLASPGSIECRTFQLGVRDRVQGKKSDPHLLGIIEIVFVLLLQGSIQAVLRTKIGYAA